MPKKISESFLLTDQQIRRRDRNARYREKKTILQATQTGRVEGPNFVYGEDNQEKEKGYAYYLGCETVSKTSYLILLPNACLLVSIISLLIYFQTTTYMEDLGLDLVTSVSISAICEGSLVYLSFAMRRSIASAFLFLSLFTYTLGTMSYGIKNTEAIEENRFLNQTVLKDNLRRAQEAFDLAQDRKETGYASRHLKTIERMSSEIDETIVETRLTRFKTFWFISLRAILMLVSALIVHRVACIIQSISR
jgi:hypothetical protein